MRRTQRLKRGAVERARARARAARAPASSAVPPSETFDSSHAPSREHRVELVVERVASARASSSRVSSESARPLSTAVAHEAGDDAVGLAERHAAAHEQVGDVGRGEELVGGGGGQALAVEASMPPSIPRAAGEAQLERVDGVEQVLLVLLHVLVVGQREPVHHAVQRDQVRDDAAAPWRAAARPRRGSSSAA